MADTPGQVIYIRSRLSTPGSDIRVPGATLRDALVAAIDASRSMRQPVDMRWDDIDGLAVLDLDDLDLGGMSVEAFISHLAVLPWLAWVSRSGEGLHLVYHAHAGFTARELAHCAAMSVIEMGVARDVEVLRRSSAPPNPDEMSEWGQPDEPRVPVGWSETIDVADDRVVAWLAEHGLTAGQRYSHEKCPFNPEASTGSPPVAVYDERIYCFRCSRGVSFTTLIAGRRPSLLIEAARALVHWQHAQLIMQYEYPQSGDREGFARSLYSSICKLIHGTTDPRLGGLFNPALKIVRTSGQWADVATLNGIQGHGRQIFPSLPSVQYTTVDAQGNRIAKADPVRLGLVSSNAKLDGYAEVVPVRGVQLWKVWNEYPDDGRVRATIPSRSPFPARYIKPASRMAEESAWRALEQSFPGLDRDYLRLLIVARIIAESGKGAVPMMAVTGATGTGKSATVVLAAELLHDEVKTIQPTVPLENFDKAFGQHAASSVGWIRLDEFAKNRPDERTMEAFEPLLLIERTYDCTRLYVGQVRVPVQSAVIISRVSIPARVLEDGQVARRVVPYHLAVSCPDWRSTSGGSIEGWRDRNKDNALVADSLISWITDEFAGPGTDPDFRGIAEAMGIDLSTPQRADEPLQEDLLPIARAVVDLYRAICGPGAIPSTETARAEKGWKIVRRGGTDPVSKAWERVCDDPVHSWASTRSVDARNLSDLCGFPPGTRLYTQERHGDLIVRFVQGQARGRRPGPFNEHIDFRCRAELQDVAEKPEQPTTVALPGAEVIAADALDDLWKANPETPKPSAPVAATKRGGMRAANAIPPQSPDESPSAGAPGSWNHLRQPAAPAGPKRIVIDLETRSEAELREVGGRVYAAHPSTTILCACAILDGQTYEWHHTEGLPGYEPPGEVPVMIARAIMQGAVLVAHNAEGFDALIWERFYGEPPGGWIDTLKAARIAGLKSVDLDSLGQVFTGAGKDADGKKFTMMYSKPRTGGQFAVITGEAMQRIQAYCRRDTELLKSLCDAGHLDISNATQLEIEVMRADRVINARGVAADPDLAKSLLVFQNAVDSREGDKLAIATNGELTKKDLKAPQRLKTWCAQHGLSLPNFQADTLTAVLNGTYEWPEDAPAVAIDPAVITVLEARVGTASVVRDKASAVLRDIGADGRIRGLFMYHAGRTGRWSSRGMQAHNFRRQGGVLSAEEAYEFLEALLADPEAAAAKYTDPIYAEAAGDILRGMIVSAPGKVLISADYSAIEARVLPWLCGDNAKVEAFRRGDPIYEMAASQLFGIPVNQVTQAQRSVGKVRELGCGYQMGEKAFALFAASNGVDLKAAGITPKQGVDSFRRDNVTIKKSWPLVRNEVMRTIRDREPRTVCRTLWEMVGNDLVATLPVGRKIRYREARIELVVPPYKKDPEWQGDTDPVDTITFSEGSEESARISTYGGKLLENLTQGTARDVLAESIVDLENAGLPVVLHVHDSATIEVDEADADEAEHEMVKIMAKDRDWAPGLPLKVEVEVRGHRWLKG